MPKAHRKSRHREHLAAAYAPLHTVTAQMQPSTGKYAHKGVHNLQSPVLNKEGTDEDFFGMQVRGEYTKECRRNTPGKSYARQHVTKDKKMYMKICNDWDTRADRYMCAVYVLEKSECSRKHPADKYPKMPDNVKAFLRDPKRYPPVGKPKPKRIPAWTVYTLGERKFLGPHSDFIDWFNKL